jgi:hypothetical protein
MKPVAGLGAHDLGSQPVVLPFESGGIRREAGPYIGK